MKLVRYGVSFLPLCEGIAWALYKHIGVLKEGRRGWCGVGRKVLGDSRFCIFTDWEGI